MPTLPIPLFTRSYKNADGTVLTDDSAVQYNGFLDALQGLNIRPGEVLAKNTAVRNDGLFMWPDVNMIVCVDASVVTLRTVSGQTLVDFASLGTITSAVGAQLVSFCSSLLVSTGAYYVFMAAGGKINYIKYLSGVADPIAEMADADAPTTVTHVAFLDGYILAISGNRLYFSDNPDNLSWAAASFASAEANPDLIQAMHVIQRQIYLLGTVSTEIWENDGTTPFARIPGGLIEVGCAAKYSVVRHDNSLIWLSHTRQFVKFTGIDIEYISSRYDKEIANFATVSDCIGGFIHKDGQHYCLFHFPTEGRTLVYNPDIDDWSEWGVWDSTNTTWDAYDFRATARDLNTGQVFIGKSSAQVIACLSSSSRVDLTGAATTTPFKFLRQTGHIDHGSGKKKRLEELRFRAKRGASVGYAGANNPVLMLRYRNNGSSQWSTIREIDLGAIGENEHPIKLKRLGIYESRQYEISATDDISIVLSNAEADITVLR